MWGWSRRNISKTDGPKDGEPPEDGGGGGGIGGFRGQRRRYDTHQSTTDPDSRLYRKSSNHDGARLAYLGHVMTDNRHGLIVDTRFTQADGYAESAAAVDMVASRPSRRRMTLGADNDSAEFGANCANAT